MTDNCKSHGGAKNKGVFAVLCELLTLGFILAALLAALFYSEEISHSTRSGLSLCTRVIIPSVFPFIILSDLMAKTLDFSSLNFSSSLFERAFGVNRSGISAFILGIVCGFPLGVRRAAELYSEGYISRDECERLIGFSNNTGPAFLVAGVGAGLRGSVTDGIILYISMLLSAILVGVIFRGRQNRQASPRPLPRGNALYRGFSLTASIKSAAISTLHICAFLTIFASACGALRNILGQSYIYLSLLPFLEVGSASSILSKTPLLSPLFSLSLTAFAVGFSGLSVHLQALSFLENTDIKVGRYFIMKLLQGALSAILAAVLYLLFNL